MKTNQKIFIFLITISAFDLLLVLARHTIWLNNELDFYPVSQLISTRGTTFLFLVWNLVLAWIPYLVGKLFPILAKLRRPKLLLLLVSVLWLLFFPNAPYILTDLFHLKARPPVPLWYDLIMILSFAWTGLLLGYAALVDLQSFIARRTGKNKEWLLYCAVIPLSSLGIFLGRYLRWNSWEVFSEPMRLLSELRHLLLQPKMLMLTVIFCLLLSALLFMFYLPFKLFQNDQPNP